MHTELNTTTTANTTTTTANTNGTRSSAIRSRWAAVGAAVAVALGGGGVGLVNATVDSGERPVLVSIEPCRLVDTRPDSQIGPRGTAIGAGEEYDVAAHGANGNCNIPAGASALSLNVTALNASAPTNVRVFAADAALPLVSNLNPNPGQPPAPNAVTTDLDAAGMFTLFNAFGTVDLIVDVNGYYEDHNHDDRYMQLGSVMWAVVHPNGNILRSSDGVESAELLDGVLPDGDYAVVFNRDISNCAYQATLGSASANAGPPPGYALVANWQGNPTHGVAVFTKGFDGAGDERGFHLTVTC